VNLLRQTDYRQKNRKVSENLFSGGEKLLNSDRAAAQRIFLRTGNNFINLPITLITKTNEPAD
jgi:hypothetical protein